jgi:hypothetical protein
MPDKPVATRNCFSWQYLLCLQKLANAVDMGFISEADMMDRLNKFGVSGFGVGSRQPRRRSVPDKHLRFGGGPGEEEAVSQPQKRAKVEPVTPSCQQQPTLLSMWCFPVASSSPPVEQSPGQESTSIAAVRSEQSREWTIGTLDHPDPTWSCPCHGSRTCSSWQYLLCFQKLADAVDMGFISEADMMDRLSKFEVSGFDVGSRQPHRRTVPVKHLRFGGGPGEEKSVSPPQKRAKLEAVTPISHKKEQRTLFSMWSSPVATGKSRVEEAPGEASSSIVAVPNVHTSDWQLVDGSLHTGGNKGGRPVKGPRRGRAAGKSSNKRDLGDQSEERMTLTWSNRQIIQRSVGV